jgi:uncharacterized protein YutE (UPF0331/DUF86 family)
VRETRAVPDDIVINKTEIVRNLQRACEACIDLAMHAVAVRSLGVPQHSRDAFRLLQEAGILRGETARRMMAMVGFRNVAIHAYRELHPPILQAILDRHLPELGACAREIGGALGEGGA